MAPCKLPVASRAPVAVESASVTEARQRLGYIDWMRGLACVLMFQTHSYDAWLGPEARQTAFFGWSQLLGTLPAPLFLFLAGVSFALVTDRLRAAGMAPPMAARRTLRRGAEIFALGLAFRVQEYLLGYPWAPWTDLLRVDILNAIGLSLVLMSLVTRLVGTRRGLVAAALAMTLAIALVTPLLWTTWRLRWLPWPLESYINGVHNTGEPQPWLFPVFPWTAFAFGGMAAGFLLFSAWARRREAAAAWLAGVAGAAMGLGAYLLDKLPLHLYPVYDFWHTSPNFFLIRLGILLGILLVVYAWCRWGAGEWGISPFRQLGRTSLLVYWVHMELVYGRFSLLPQRQNSIAEASLGLLTIFLLMLLLSWVRTRFLTLRRKPA